ncbi:MAG TPA: hypothetical protein DCO72_08200 [Ruminococcus sp.]|nr:hypothetical protein [Ruminococcus sp.]
MTGLYCIADKNIEICSLYAKVQEYCKGYETTGIPDFSIVISEDDIIFEREKSNQEHVFENLPIPDFSEETLEITAVYRKIAEKMIDYDTFVFHGSVVAVENQAFLFTAKSGTGKSTHTRLWREYLGERAVMVNDDKPLINISENGIMVYGTPWNGKHRLGRNICVPLKALCILTRAEENHIEKISKSQAYAMLLQQVYRSQNPEKMQKTLALIDKFADGVELYRLGCNMSWQAVEVSYNGMKG